MSTKRILSSFQIQSILRKKSISTARRSTLTERVANINFIELDIAKEIWKFRTFDRNRIEIKAQGFLDQIRPRDKFINNEDIYLSAAKMYADVRLCAFHKEMSTRRFQLHEI